MASITSLKASDGTGNASVATVQSVRSSGATTLVVDTVQGINTKFHATMGTPHTFVDPVTSETITVISEATAVDFAGHVDGSNLEIDTIAPGFTDAGSAVNDIVIIKPTTQWADEVAKVLEVTHNDNGTLKTDSVDSTQIKANAITTPKLADDAITAAKIDWASTGANGGIWWEEIGRTTLGSNADSISVTVAARKYLCVLISTDTTGGNTTHGIRFNSDTGNNYAIRYSDGATSTSQSEILIQGAINIPTYITLYITNITAKEKFVQIGRNGGATGAGNAPTIIDRGTGKWANTAAQITTIELRNTSTGDYTSGSELVVLGHD